MIRINCPRPRRGGRAITVASLALAAAVLPSIASAAWQQPVGGASPINRADGLGAGHASLTAIGFVPHVAWSQYDDTNSAANHGAGEPSLMAVAGIPYVAWHEFDGSNTEVRVSRLEPELTSQNAVASATGATLRASAHAYGIPYPIGFQRAW